MFRAALLLLTALSLVAQTTPIKTKKLSEIDQRIATLQTEIDGLKALRASISSGQLPDSAIAMISVQPNSSSPAGIVSPTPIQQTVAPVTTPATARAVVTTPTRSSPYILGPRGGCYTLTSGGNKKYVDHSMCR